MTTVMAGKSPRPSRFANSKTGLGVLGSLGLACAILLWGANWPVMKVGLSHVSPLWFSALRFATGAACLFGGQALRGELQAPKREDLPFIASIGLLQMTLFTAFGAWAMTELPAGRSAILSYTTPIWVLPAVYLLGERIQPRRLVGVAFAVAGVAILLNPHAVNWSDRCLLEANGLLLAASACWAICILHLRYGRPASSAIALAPWQMALATIVLTPTALVFEGLPTGDGTAAFWLSLLFVGPVATSFCFCVVNAASSRLPASVMSTLMLAVPVTGLAISMATLHETPSVDLLLGAFVIVIGIAVNAMPSRPNTISLEAKS